MFDELDKNPTAPLSQAGPSAPAPKPLAPALPPKAEDIFAEVDKAAKPEVFQPNPDRVEPPRGTVMPPATGWKSNKIMVFILLFGGLAVVIAGGYFGLKLAMNEQSPADNTPAPIVEQPANNQAPAKTQPAEIIDNTGFEPTEPIESAEPAEPIVSEPIDSDLDGLIDEEEVILGTNSYNPDSDQDGLTDREEAKVYLTDPLKADTDGDGYNDGDEVNNGYNPKGAGKLLEIR